MGGVEYRYLYGRHRWIGCCRLMEDSTRLLVNARLVCAVNRFARWGRWREPEKQIGWGGQYVEVRGGVVQLGPSGS